MTEDSDWRLPSEFTYNNSSITGIWVEVTEIISQRDDFDLKEIFTTSWLNGRDVKVVK